MGINLLLKQLFVSLGVFFVFILSILTIICNGDSFSYLYPSILLLVFLFIMMYFITERSMNKSLANWGFRPSYICLIGLLIVNLQYYVDQALGISEVAKSIGESWVTLYLDKCFFGGCLFIVVYLISNTIGQRDLAKSLIKNSPLHEKPWLFLQLGFFILFILHINIISFLTGNVYLNSGSSDTVEGLSNSLERLYNASSIITLAIYTKKISLLNIKTLLFFFKKIPLLFWIPMTIYLVLRLFSGDRGPVIYSILAIFYAYILVSQKRINFKWTIGIIICGAFIITLLGYIRSRSTDLALHEKVEQAFVRMKEKQSLESPTISPLTKELAQSSQCNFIAVRDIEQHRINYTFGKYTILTAFSSFPGAKKEYFKPMGLSESDFSSATYLTQSHNGTKYYSYGIGSSVFGEAYLDFDIIGVICIAAFLGYFFKRIDLSYKFTSHLSIVNIIILLKLSSTSIYVSRSSFSQITGSILSILIIYWIFSFTFNQILYKKYDKNIVLH